MNWAINNFYFIVLRSKCVNYFVDKLPVGASDDEVVYINGDGYLDGFDNTVALYRTVQDCWTLDLAGHGRNPSLQDLELHENHETVAT